MINSLSTTTKANQGRLLALIISWNRPRFLQVTLDSLFDIAVTDSTDVIVVDNGSDAETCRIIEKDSRLAGFRLLGENLGLNGALEAVLTDNVLEQYECLLISDADMEYRISAAVALDFLQRHREIGAVSYQHSPEHAVVTEFESNGRHWLTKWSERGCSLFLRVADYRRLRPLPVDNLKDFDWWVVRDAPQSLQQRGLPVAVLPGGAIHLGWRAGDSTWQELEIPEYDEFKATVP